MTRTRGSGGGPSGLIKRSQNARLYSSRMLLSKQGGKLTETYGNFCANGTQAFPKRLETDDGNAVVIDFWKLGGETFISNVPGRYNIRLMSRGAVSVAVVPS